MIDLIALQNTVQEQAETIKRLKDAMKNMLDNPHPTNKIMSSSEVISRYDDYIKAHNSASRLLKELE